MSHYFTNDAALTSDEKLITARVCGVEFQFVTDAGVFSKGKVDKESQILVETADDVRGGVLDLGCGWGFVGIVLKKLFPNVNVAQTDINRRAAALCARNAVLNGVETKVTVGDKFSSVNGTFDTIFLNPPIHAGKETIFSIYEQSPRFLKKGGTLRVVAAEKHGAKSHVRKLDDVFGNCSQVYKKKGIYVVYSRSDFDINVDF